MPNFPPQVTAALIGLAGIIVGLLLRGIGSWLWHLATKGPTKDRAALIGTMADAIAKMRASGISQDDLDQFERYLKGKAEPSAVIAQPTSDTEVDTKSISYFEGGMEPFEPNTQMAMNLLAQAKAIDVEAQIHRRLDRLKEVAGEDQVEMVDAAQAAWEAYRDAQARVATEPFAGGSIRHLIWWSEIRVASVERLKQIEAEIAQREADALL